MLKVNVYEDAQPIGTVYYHDGKFDLSDRENPTLQRVLIDRIIGNPSKVMDYGHQKAIPLTALRNPVEFMHCLHQQYRSAPYFYCGPAEPWDGEDIIQPSQDAAEEGFDDTGVGNETPVYRNVDKRKIVTSQPVIRNRKRSQRG